MLKTIVSISGKPGLFKVVSQAKNMLIVESLKDKKRIPTYSRDKIVSLGDISMFTQGEDKPLGEILESMKTIEGGKKASIDVKSDADSLRGYFEKILPDFDRDRVYVSDIKKLIQWYDILIEVGSVDFISKKEEKEVTEK